MGNFYSVKKDGLYDPAFEHDACGVGFVANIKGIQSHGIVKDGIQILSNLEHRGAIAGDKKTGDGAGMLLQLPHKFFKKSVDFKLPDAEKYGAGMFFFPQDKDKRKKAVKLTKDLIKKEGFKLLGIREVPVNPDCLGEFALKDLPNVKQIFVQSPSLSGDELENRLYTLRKVLENGAMDQGLDFIDYYVCSLSCRTMVYKGMFVSAQFTVFFPDLMDEDFESAIALVHQRYSTNTFPSWPLAQPFRYIAHNGEINTLRRNRNNMKARETTLSSEAFGDDITKLSPVINSEGSDSACFDNVFELIHRGGRRIEHSMMMMIPEAFGSKYHMSQDKRLFYEYHASIMEPWDGPAAMAFTDGLKIGATLDRNGLRPGRYTITRSNKIVMASETGVIDVAPEDVLEKGRLAPGKMLLVDTVEGRVLKDNQIKSSIIRSQPYRRWLEDNKIELSGLFGHPTPVTVEKESLYERMRAFGYSQEDLKTIIAAMAKNSQEPIGSMGNDSPVAVLSEKAPLLYDFFRQLFAQVTNPPIDPYRENLVMSLMSFVGKEQNLLGETPEHCRQLKLAHPVLTNDDLVKIKNSKFDNFDVYTVPMVFEADSAEGTLERALEDLALEVERKVDDGASLVILSDRGVNDLNAPIPALLAMGAVHNHLVNKGKRHLTGIIIESGEVREVHHFACLIGFGASGINPYLVFESINELKNTGYLPESLKEDDAIVHYITAVKKGLLKIMSKMGISTIRSYRGAQIFEIVGLSKDLVNKYFHDTVSRIGGMGLADIQKDVIDRHQKAYDEKDPLRDTIESGGKYNYRAGGERHLFSAEAIINMQKAVRTSDYTLFKKYSSDINDISKNLSTLRGLFQFKEGNPVPIDEVESVKSIVKRFVSSAMSFGSLSKEVHETMAIAMNSINAHSNSGEGGEDEARFIVDEDGQDRRSYVKQVASGRFGVDANYLANCDEIQIKMAQGAKPGEGGQLPGHKVNDVIARVRHSTPGVMLISPPPHHDIYSIEDLSQLIFDLRNANPKARVSVKLVSEVGVGTVAAGVAKGKADMVLISGSDGGTGASPLSSIKYAGSYWEIGLAETQQVLVKNRLRSKIKVQVDGQLKTGRDVVIGALLGAEEFGFGSCSLVSLGCVMLRKCHSDSCSMGIATQRPELRKRFQGKPEHLVNFMTFIAQEVREIMAEMGFRTFEEMIGRVDMIEMNDAVDFYRAKGIDFSEVLQKPEVPEGETLYCTTGQEYDWSLSLDPAMVKKCQNAIETGEPIEITQEIKNCNRTVGAILSNAVTVKHGSKGLPEDTIKVKLNGNAGQSFAAFLNKGITFELEGDSNDFLGKGLSGGKIIIYPPKAAKFIPERNIITGNVSFFGATGGEAYINGCAGERFCVRNSGVTTVVEGVGDHACEYMTGGRVIILGETGVNFAAGMSGGIAYVYDVNQLFDTRCNHEMVDVEPVISDSDQNFLKKVITNQLNYTGSPLAKRLLDNWEENLPLFVKVMPIDYKKALEKMSERESRNSESTSVTEEVY